jgi:hypothetical protein
MVTDIDDFDHNALVRRVFDNAAPRPICPPTKSDFAPFPFAVAAPADGTALAGKALYAIFNKK